MESGPHEGFGDLRPTLFLSRRDEPERGKSRLHIRRAAVNRNPASGTDGPQSCAGGADPTSDGRDVGQRVTSG